MTVDDPGLNFSTPPQFTQISQYWNHSSLIKLPHPNSSFGFLHKMSQDSTDRGRRKTRWSGKSARFVEFGGHQLDTVISGHLTQEQITAYQQYFRVEEISHYLRKAGKGGTSLFDCLPSKSVENYYREPSPPPKYDQSGNRINSRESRAIENLEKERHALVEIAVTSIKNYDPPLDYKKAGKTTEKLYIPVQEYPDINFVGLLLGPRGNTLRQLQEESGAKLAIRGKGSVKEGKEMDLAGSQGNEDSLHVVISADTTAMVNKAIKLTNEVIEKAISSPVGQNDFKRDQLRQLAVLNGTLRETKPFTPPESYNQQRSLVRDVTQIVCRTCGNIGHYTRDCKFRNERQASPESGPRSFEGDFQDQKRQRTNNYDSQRGLSPNQFNHGPNHGPVTHLPPIPPRANQSRNPSNQHGYIPRPGYGGEPTYRSPPPSGRPNGYDHYIPKLTQPSREAPPPPPIAKPVIPRPPPPSVITTGAVNTNPAPRKPPPPPPPTSSVKAPPPPTTSAKAPPPPPE